MSTVLGKTTVPPLLICVVANHPEQCLPSNHSMFVQDSYDKLEETRATPQKDNETILSGDQYKTDELFLQALGG